MARYDFRCVKCETDVERDMSIKAAPPVGGGVDFTHPDNFCECGSGSFVRVMDKKGGSFKFNLRRTGIL